MSADKAAPDASPAPKAGKKKLIIIIAAALVLLLGGGGAGALYLKGKAAKAAAEAAEADGDDSAKKDAHGGDHADAGHPPTFLPLDPFVVNLADKDADRYVQIGITLEVDNALFADQMKGYMPAIRNTILLIIAGKTSRDLIDRSGKEDLAEEIQREAVRPMGIDIAKPMPVKKVAVADDETKGEQDEVPAKGSKADKSHEDDGDEKPAKGKGKGKRKVVPNPVHHVHFSSFIIQ